MAESAVAFAHAYKKCLHSLSIRLAEKSVPDVAPRFLSPPFVLG